MSKQIKILVVSQSCCSESVIQDGTYKGALQNVEVLMYTITVEYYENGGTETKTGTITLTR